MAKFMSDATVTVENATGRFVFKTQGVSVSSTTGGASHHVRVEPHAQMVENGKAFNGYAQGGTTPKSAAMTKREAVIKHVLEMAKAVDKQQFEGARLIEQAVEENNLAYNAKMHQFQLAVLSALHEGITDMEVEAVLRDTNLPSFDEEVQAVARRDMRVGYLTSEDASVQE